VPAIRAWPLGAVTTESDHAVTAPRHGPASVPAQGARDSAATDVETLNTTRHPRPRSTLASASASAVDPARTRRERIDIGRVSCSLARDPRYSNAMVAGPCDGTAGSLWGRIGHILNLPGSDGERHERGSRRNVSRTPPMNLRGWFSQDPPVNVVTAVGCDTRTPF
jgi:hypothetical protein